MALKSYRLLTCILLLLISAFSLKAQTTRSILLKHVDSLPLPPRPGGTSSFITVNEQSEIIAITRSDFGDEVFNTCGIVASTLGKGKILLLGPSDYLKAAMLVNKGVAQFLKNAVKWSKPGTSPVHIAVAESIDKGFAKFLSQQNAVVYTAKKFILKKNTNLLVLNKDVTDVNQLTRIENFITTGGTLLFASPYSDLTSSAGFDNKRVYDLSINKLFAKAGVVNPQIMITRSPEHSVLPIDSIPANLHLKMLLPLMRNQAKFSESADFFNNLTIDMAFKYNDPNSAIMKHIRQMLSIPAVMPLPSWANPVLNNTPTLKMAHKIGYREYVMLQDFDHHPEAKMPGYKIFPGDVPASAQRVEQTVTIPVKVGTQGLNDPGSVYYRPHSTGLYVPAGEKVTITISERDIKQQFRAQIGVHKDDVTHLDQFRRVPLDMTTTFRLDVKQVDVYSPYGGLLLINIADTTTLKTITINVKGAVKAPYFKLGETSEQDWNVTIRNNPAPWAEIASDKIVLTVPSYRIRNLSNPVKLMQFWDEVLDADADLAIISRKRVHQERIIVENDMAAGYMFTDEDRIVSPDDESCVWMLDEPFMRSHGSWGTFHELGHRHQFSAIDFPGTGEVTVNLFTMYVYDKVLHKGLYNHDGMENMTKVVKVIKDYLADNPSYEKWSKDPFLALSMYIQIIDAFGWDAIKAVHTIYRNLPKDQYPKTDQDKRDLWFTSICKVTNSNMSHFFNVWKIEVSDAAKKEVSGYKVWFPKELEN